MNVTQDLGNGFRHHGVATDIANSRGLVATVDGQGRNVVLLWLYDHRGCYALLLIDAETGASEQYPLPFPPGDDFNACPFSSILSSGNLFCSHFHSRFLAFDPAARAFTFWHETVPQMAMGMTEDDDGRIWAATHPDSGVLSFDPQTRAFRDYGHVYKQNWRQYPRSVAADAAGWVYFGIGSTASQIVSLDPDSGAAEPILSEGERVQGSGHVYRDLNGKVYGHAGDGSNNWFELYRGARTPVGTLEDHNEKPIVTGSQGLFHRDFPDGKRILSCNLETRTLSVEDPDSGEIRDVGFEYTTEGAHVMGLAAAPDGTLSGGTTFPARFFSYDPATDTWTNRPNRGQWNTVARQADRFFAGAYTGGLLLEWGPAEPWVPTEKDNPGSNPRFLTECKPAINRPHTLLAHPDGQTVILAGTPNYGHTGGGMMFWDRETGSGVLLGHTEILPDHSTMSLVALPDGNLLGGSTTDPGTGGERKAEEAELYVMDIETRRVLWREVVFPGVQSYTDLCPGPGGVVYGIADRECFFVFDPDSRRVLHSEITADRYGLTARQQGPRVFVTTSAGNVYMLFIKGIVRVDPSDHSLALLAESPVPIGFGGDWLNGRIYFGSGSHVYSFGECE